MANAVFTPLVGLPKEPPKIIVPGIISPRGPLVKVVGTKWERDPGMADLLDYFDAPRFEELKTDAERFGALTTKEVQAISDIAAKCRNDFSYCARNFFWITDKKRGAALFSLWESQELIYERMLALRAKGRAQKIMVLKARQLGCSTLIEGLIAWRTIFFKNVNAIVVSYDPEHAAYLFGIMQYIYDRLPWWIKPMCSAREYKDGLTFENPDPADRRKNPGLGSRVMVQAANKRTGVGVGVRISAAHLSEFALWNQDYARDVIEEELGNALAENQETFAVLESTGNGMGYSYDLWNKNVEMGDDAEWQPVFLPFFFESTRVLAPPNGWIPEPPEKQIQQRIATDWLRCDNAQCLQYHERFEKINDRTSSICQTCKIGTLNVYELTPGQMYWMHRKRKNAEKDTASLKKLRQAMCSTWIEAFQTSGTNVFTEESMAYVDSMVRPPIKQGFLDKNGKFHGCNPKDMAINPSNGEYYERCYLDGCDIDHGYGDEHGEHPLRIWKMPDPNSEYVIGGDVSEGLGGSADFSVGAVLRVSRTGGADEVVAIFRSNTTDTIGFAVVLNALGWMYKDKEGIPAMMAIEVNRYDTCLGWIRNQLQYPNLYRWKNIDSVNQVTTRFGWVTQQNSKPRLWQTLRRWLRDRIFMVYSQDFAKEMRTFTKDDIEERGASHEHGSKDDTLMSCVPAGTMVTTSIGLRPIESVKVGDLVLTHTGKFMPVLRTMSKIHEDGLVKIDAIGRPPLLLTSDHKMYLWEKYATYRESGKPVLRRNKYRNPRWISADTATKSLMLYGTCSVPPSAVEDVEYIDMKCFVPDGYAVRKKGVGIGYTKRGSDCRINGVTEHIPVDKDMLRMVGYFLAEGAKGHHNVVFSSHDREEPIRSWLIGYLRKIGLNPGTIKQSANGTNIFCSSMVLRSFFVEFGKSTGKRLPQWTQLLPPEKQREIIIGYLIGDGCFMRQSGIISANTISQEAAMQIFNMSLRCGWPVAMRENKGQNGHYNQWSLRYSSHTAEMIKNLIEPDILACKRPLYRSIKESHNKINIHDGILIGQIISAEKIQFNGVVYDIEVAEDHSFVANGTVVSNCMIALYCAHEGDWDDSLQQVNVSKELTLEEAPWHVHCMNPECNFIDAASSTDKLTRCRRCNTMVIQFLANRDARSADNQMDAFAGGRISQHEAQEYAQPMQSKEDEIEWTEQGPAVD